MKNVVQNSCAYGVSAHKTAQKERQAPPVNIRVTVKRNSAVPSIRVPPHSKYINQI